MQNICDRSSLDYVSLPTEFEGGAVSLLLQQSTRYCVVLFFFSFLFLSESSGIIERELRSDRSSDFDWLNPIGGLKYLWRIWKSMFLFFLLLTPYGVGLFSLSTCGLQSQTTVPRPWSLPPVSPSSLLVGCVSSNYLNCAETEKLKRYPVEWIHR